MGGVPLKKYGIPRNYMAKIKNKYNKKNAWRPARDGWRPAKKIKMII